MTARGPWVLPVLVAVIAATLVAAVGATMTDLGPWYRGLAQPRWAPPDAAFGAIWTVVFALTSLAGVTAWRRTPDRASGDWLIGLFALNGFLNIVWSLLFFRLHRPDWAQIEVVALWASIVVLIFVCRRYSTIAALLLVPYLIWVSIASVLNVEVVQLNSPFA